MKYLTLLAMLLLQQAFAQSVAERELKTTVSNVTVFLQGGLITRTGSVDIPPGKSLLKMRALSPFMDSKSIRVKAEGEFTVLSVNHQLNHLSQLKKDARIDSLNKQLKAWEVELLTRQSRLEVLAEKQSLLDKNKRLGRAEAGTSLDQIGQAVQFYDQALTAIKSEEVRIKLEMEEINEQKTRLKQELAGVQGEKDLPSGEIEIRVDAAAAVRGTFTISYMVGNAGWYPSYDVRVTSIEQPLQLTYKAEVYQHTGVDWENVKLKFSNATPNQSGLAPELETWYLNYTRNTRFKPAPQKPLAIGVQIVSGKVLDENGDPLAGAAVMVEGTTVGTFADEAGNFTLTLPNDASQLLISYVGYETTELPITAENLSTRLQPQELNLSEVVTTRGLVAGLELRAKRRRKQPAADITTTTIENQTTVEFELDAPYSIKSEGEKRSINLRTYEVAADYIYYAVPKLDKDAFLMANIPQWESYNLLQGEANLYFEDAYVGRTILDAGSLNDTLQLSLGRDKSILIGREKITDFTRRKIMGNKLIESRRFRMLIRNKKSQPIKLRLYDQLPLAVINDIVVTPSALSGGKMDEQSGEVFWELELAPQQQIELLLGYEVKYPKSERVILE